MSATITRQFSGDCPYTGNQQTISLEYYEVPMLGSSSPGYKRLGGVMSVQ